MLQLINLKILGNIFSRLKLRFRIQFLVLQYCESLYLQINKIPYTIDIIMCNKHIIKKNSNILGTC